VSFEYGLAGAAQPSRVLPGPVASGLVRRRRAILAGGCVLAATALLVATGPASHAATVGSWQDYTISALSGGSLTGGIYAPTLNDAWAAGIASDGSTTVYAHFTGSGWTSASGPQIGRPVAIGGSSDSDVWVAGSTAFAHYNGSAWTTDDPAAPPDGFYDASNFPSEVYGAGSGDAWALVPFDLGSYGGPTETVLEHFDGTSWSVVDLPSIPSGDTLIAVTGSGPDNVWVEASNTSLGQAEFLSFDGSSWSVVQVPNLSGLENGQTLGLSVTGPGDALVTGMTDSQDFVGATEQEISGTWSAAPMPDNQEDAIAQTAGVGHAWAEVESIAAVYEGVPAPETLWEWSAGTWQQNATNPYASITAVGDGSGLWSYDPTSGSAALYDAG
jgi:hypothetical protein